MYKMRRSQREIKDIQEIYRIIKGCDVIRIGMSVDNIPYIVPLNFGFEEDTFYFHGAQEGRKIDMIKANPNVCFELDTNHHLVGESDNACEWTMTYTSVMGTGTMVMVDEYEEKIKALNILMKNYGGKDSYDYPEKMVRRIGIMKLEVKEYSGKKSE